MAEQSIAQDHKELVQMLAEMLKDCAKKGFELPLSVALVSANGSVLVTRYIAGKEHLEPLVLAQHIESNAFILSINIMIADARGEAARVLIESPNRWHTVH